MEIFSQRLKELRFKKGLSLAELAKETNINKGTLIKWEEGKSIPRTKNFIILVKFFGVSSDYLLGFEDD